jgi:hypothetical protein
VLVKWICNFTEKWEEVDQEHNVDGFDISYSIQAAMHEAYMWMELHLIDLYGIEIVRDWKVSVEKALTAIYKTTLTETHIPYLLHKQMMRVIFKHPDMFAPMCNLAGKIMQLEVICFQANVLPSTKQRSDIWEQYSTANTELFAFISGWDSFENCPLNIFRGTVHPALQETWSQLINRVSMPTITDTSALWRFVDLELALSIASGAGIPTHDTLGNISAHVWTRRTNVTNDASHTHLVATQDIRRLLLEQIKTQLENHKTSILEADDAGPVVRWIFNYAKKWQELYYAKIQEKYAISQQILAVMQETYELTKPFMCDIVGEDVFRSFTEHVKITIATLKTNRENTLHDTTAPCIALFRHTVTGPALVRVACKLMAKRLMCDKPGVYASVYQRSDAEQQLHDSLAHFIESMQDCHPPLKEVFQGTSQSWELICQSYPDT